MKKAEVWKTSDGEMFDDEDMAYNHEKYLIISENMNGIYDSVFGGLNLSMNQQLKEKFLANYEVMKHAINTIESEIKKLNDGDEDWEQKDGGVCM